MPDQPEPKGLTAEHTIERLERFADGAFAAGATGVRLSFVEFREVITMARLSLTLQRRAEEAEARVAQLERRISRLNLCAVCTEPVRRGQESHLANNIHRKCQPRPL